MIEVLTISSIVENRRGDGKSVNIIVDDGDVGDVGIGEKPPARQVVVVVVVVVVVGRPCLNRDRHVLRRCLILIRRCGVAAAAADVVEVESFEGVGDAGGDSFASRAMDAHLSIGRDVKPTPRAAEKRPEITFD